MKIEKDIYNDIGALMKLLIKINRESWAWKIRRLYNPIPKDYLVLEVGSGGNPYARSNVLSDAYIETQERWFAPLVTDRPAVIAFVENLPFKDNTFDHVIASHVLEHSKDPERFLSELQRVSKSGYIEVPDAMMERLITYGDHRLEIYKKNDVLYIKKKKNYIEDEDIYKLYHQKFSRLFGKIVSKHPFHFHVRYYWSKSNGGIKYIIENPDSIIHWESPKINVEVFPKMRQRLIYRNYKRLIKLSTWLFSQRKRNKGIKLQEYIQCPKCSNDKFKDNPENFVCNKCHASFKKHSNNIIDFVNN
jgi:SAM-dependent methyltransferase